MGQGGLEPPTPRLSSVCSNQLSYWPPTSALPKPPKEVLGKPSPSQGRNTPDTTTGEGCADGADPRKGQAHHAPHANQWPQVMAGKYCLSGHRRPNQTQPIRARPVKGRSRSILVIVQAADSKGPKPLPHPRSLKGGDPAAGSPTATLLRLHPSH